MASLEKIIQELNKPLDKRVIATFGQNAGAKAGLSYLEGHFVIRELNRVFNHEWTFELDGPVTLINSRKATIGRNESEGIEVTYMAQGSLNTVLGSRADVGFGTKKMPIHILGECHEFAAKEAVTDCIKRCAKDFGDPFGLALYEKEGSDGGRTNVRDVAAEKQALLIEVIKHREIDQTEAVKAIRAAMPEGKVFEELDPNEIESLRKELFT